MSRLPVIQAPSVVAEPSAPLDPLRASRRIYVDTYGCQMNMHDTDRIFGLMAAEGYAPAATPDEADLIVINSCNVREKAEHKLRTAAGKMKRYKRRRPGTIIALGGCVAQQEGKRLLERAPHVDLVFGPDHLSRLPELVRRIAGDRARLDETAFLSRSEYVFPEIRSEAARQVSAFVTVMKGCDKFCTFCVVPNTRGREVSRSAAEIVREVEMLAAKGTREVVLLGQTVNAYGRIKQQGQIPFHELLAQVAAVPGIERVRFTSPHPAEFSDAQILAFRDIPELCPHMHLPVQSGSDRILASMRRGYTQGRFIEIVDRLREVAPQVALTTDIIVGFPGESAADFEATLELMRRVRFHGAFSFAFSERSGTKAADFEDAVPPEERMRRLHVLQALQDEHTAQWQAQMVGQRFDVLVHGPSKTNAQRSSGRAPNNRTVHIDGQIEAGALVAVEIDESYAHSLHGRLAG